MTENSFLAFAQRIRIRLFLEGVEIPVISANVTAAPNSPAVCSLQLPPVVEGTRLLPRTLVHLFFLDAYETTNPFVLDSDTAGKLPDGGPTDPTVTDATAYSPPVPENATYITATPCGDTAPHQWSNRRYKLMFGGEVVGFSWTKNPMSRSLILQCEDWSNYWDYAYQWSNTGIFGPGNKALFSGGATNLFTDFLSSQGSVLASILLQGKCNAFPKLKGLAAGIIRLCEAVGGSYYTRPSGDSTTGNASKKFAGQNIFFSIAELRLHITQMITAYEDDPTSKRLLARQGYDGMFNRVLGGLGQQVSIRQAMNAISRIIFHETYPQPCPHYKPGRGTDPQGTRRVRISNDPNLARFAGQATDILRGLKAVQAKVEELSGESALQLQAFNPAVQAIMKDISVKLQKQRSALEVGSTQLSSSNAPPILKSIYSMAIKALKQAENAAIYWRPAARTTSQSKLFEAKLNEAVTQLSRVPDLTVNTTPLKELEPARLVQHILRPDIWFGAPPRCNVLFPDMYEQISYQRSFLQEPTRLMLKTNDEFFGEDELFDKLYFAPQSGSLKSDKARLQQLLRNDVLDHELFTGILPVFEKMGEFNVFAARANDDKSGKVAKIGFAQRSANFLYFKHRFNARQFQVNGRFNPYVAVGFPGLVIDKWVDRQVADRIRAMRDEYIAVDPEARNRVLPKYSAELIGANFLANFVEVTHSVSQEQLRGVTSIRCTYARQADEDAEFLGVTERTTTVQKRQEGDAKRTTDVAAISAPDLFSLGPNQGRVTQRQEVTDKYVRSDSSGEITSGTELPVFFSGSRREGGLNKIQQVYVPIGVTFKPSDRAAVDQAILIQYLGSDREVTFKAWAVEEEVPRYKLEEIDIPPEELIRPGWYGDNWSPGKIGNVYKDFFGIGSITEPTVILDGGANANEKFVDAIAKAQTGEDADNAIMDLPIVTSLGENSTIQQSVEFITLTYSYVKQADLDADEFIRTYTWRPIATLIDMFGSENLVYDSNGIAPTTSGVVEGFHSRAFGPYDDVFGLVTPEIETVLGIDRGSTTAQRADTRKRKLERVQALFQALNFSRAQIG